MINVHHLLLFHFQLDLVIVLVSEHYFYKVPQIDQHFAGLEERVIFSTLFRHFSFHSNQTIDELHLCVEVILIPGVPIQMFIERRKHFQ